MKWNSHACGELFVQSAQGGESRAAEYSSLLGSRASVNGRGEGTGLGEGAARGVRRARSR